METPRPIGLLHSLRMKTIESNKLRDEICGIFSVNWISEVEFSFPKNIFKTTKLVVNIYIYQQINL